MSAFKIIKGSALRATKTDGCGAPVLGPDSQLVTDAFVTTTFSPQTQTADAIQQTNANGKLCINEQASPQFTNFLVTVALCGADPELINFLTGQPLVLNEAGEVVGFRMNSKVNVDLTGVAIETWSVIPADLCEPGSDGEAGYMLLPFLKGGVLGDVVVQNGTVDFTVSGMISKDGTGWGVGPYDIRLDDAGLEGPLLEPMDPDGDHFHLERVGVPAPAPTDGAVPLGVPATGATAGTPGSFTPANSYGPATLAGLTGVTASPSTAWTTGQRVRLRDGSYAHWSGTAWVAGVA